MGTSKRITRALQSLNDSNFFAGIIIVVNEYWI